MDPFSAFLIYFLTWWMVFFCVLPWGVRRDGETGTGAPVNPRLKEKFLITSGISAVIWVLIYLMIVSDIVDFRAISMGMIQEDYQ